MKICNVDTYLIEMYKESKNRTDHNKIKENPLYINGADLKYAIISAGMPEIYLAKSVFASRKEEISFKVRLFETFVVLKQLGINLYELSFDFAKKDFLDSTEIGAINYWIGMILITALGQKKYGYEYMVHLSMIHLMSKHIVLKKRPYKSKGKIYFKSPDLIAVDSYNNRFGVFESKGYSDYSGKAMERAYDQAKSIKKINRKKPAHRLAVMTLTGKDKIQMIEKDPDGRDIELEIDTALLDFYHYTPIVQLINELKPIKNELGMQAILEIGESVLTITVAETLYRLLLPYLSVEKESGINKYLDENLERIAGCMEEIRGNNALILSVE